MTPERVLHQIAAVLVSLSLAVTAGAQTSAPAKKAAPPPPKSSTAAPPKLQIDPKAVEVLKAASDKLAGAMTLSFTAVELFESPSRQGAPLAYTNKYEVTIQRPDKLRVIRPGDAQAADFYLDGKSMTAYVPGPNLIAKTDAPPNIDAALEAAYKKAAIYLPFTDLIVANPYGDMASGIRHAYYIGQSHVVGGTTTDMVAYADEGVFAELWIGADDKLPRLVRAVFLNDPNRLRHEMAFTDWKLDEPVSEGTFTPQNSADAKPIPFARPASQPPNAPKPAKA